jgi:hypothetical protein
MVHKNNKNSASYVNIFIGVNFMKNKKYLIRIDKEYIASYPINNNDITKRNSIIKFLIDEFINYYQKSHNIEINLDIKIKVELVSKINKIVIYRIEIDGGSLYEK